MARVIKVKATTGKQYEVQWSWYVDKDTRRFKRERFRTLAEAKAKLRVVDAQVASGQIPDYDAGKETVKMWGERWLAAKEPVLKPSTYRSYKAIWTSSVEPEFGAQRLRSVTIEDVERFITSLQKRSPLTIRHHIWVLGQVFKRAMKQRAITYNPVEFVDVPTARSTGRLPHEPHFLTAEEVEQIASQLDTTYPNTPWGLLVRFTAWTGLRAGEVAGLNIADVDLIRRTVTVRRTRQKRTSEWLVHTPKSGKQRVVPIMSDWLRDDLTDYLATHPHNTDPAAPFWPGTKPGGYSHGERGSKQPGSTPAGSPDYGTPTTPTPWEPGTFYRRRFRPAVAAVGLPAHPGGGVRFHDLRHTFASLAASKGVPSAQVAVWMGHSSDVITREIYTHLFDADSARHAERMGTGDRPRSIPSATVIPISDARLAI